MDSVVEGIGCNRVTGNFEQGRGWVDDAVRVSDREAGRMSRWLVERDGIFVGGSSAVNCEYSLSFFPLFFGGFGFCVGFIWLKEKSGMSGTLAGRCDTGRGEFRKGCAC